MVDKESIKKKHQQSSHFGFQKLINFETIAKQKPEKEVFPAVQLTERKDRKSETMGLIQSRFNNIEQF